MRAFAIVLLATLLLVTPALAQSGYKYDWQSGNSYNWYRQPDGSTQVHGYNYQTGSTWDSTIRPNGDMRGRDSQGNIWQYNESSGFYQNYGTGRTCIGHGYARTCN
jgi:hypothetical protein